jgi:hypothetical protein
MTAIEAARGISRPHDEMWARAYNMENVRLG